MQKSCNFYVNILAFEGFSKLNLDSEEKESNTRLKKKTIINLLNWLQICNSSKKMSIDLIH
jgi:hypothetical protein